MRETRYIEGNGWRVGVLVTAHAAPPGAPTLTPTHGEYPIYDALLYEAMIADDERNWRFREALQRHAKNRTVLDIGTGAFLFWARESLQAGARRVVAMEAMPGSFKAASQALEKLDGGDRITLLHGDSTALTIDPKAEVCVAEIIGSLPGAEGAASVLADAKRRLLTPDAVIVPDQCATRAAAVGFNALFAGREPAFAPESVAQLQRLFEWHGGPFDIRLRVANPSRHAILSNTETVETLDFNGQLCVEQTAQVRLTIVRPGPIDGVLTWVSIQCLPDQEPLDALEGKTNWASIYLPLFDTAISVEPGDVLHLTFRTALSDDGVHPDYHLSGTLHTATGFHEARYSSLYRHSTLRGHPIYAALFPA